MGIIEYLVSLITADIAEGIGHFDDDTIGIGTRIEDVFLDDTVAKFEFRFMGTFDVAVDGKDAVEVVVHHHDEVALVFFEFRGGMRADELEHDVFEGGAVEEYVFDR